MQVRMTGVRERADLIKWIIPLLVSIAGVILPIFITPSNQNQKSLSYEIVSASEIRLPSSSVLSDLKITLGDEVLENVGITLVKLTNNGDVPIVRSDFDRPLVLEIPKETRLLRSTIESQFPNNLGVKLEQNGNSVFVEPVLLNSNNAFIIQLVTTGVMSAPSVNSRISGVHDAELVVSSSTEESVNILQTVIGVVLLLTYGLFGGWFIGSMSYIEKSEGFMLGLMALALAGGSAYLIRPAFWMYLDSGLLSKVGFALGMGLIAGFMVGFARNRAKIFYSRIENGIGNKN